LKQKNLKGFGMSGRDNAAPVAAGGFEPRPVRLSVNEQIPTMAVEPRMTLLDALREELALAGTKKACDRCECGACTVHVEGRRILSCLMLAVMVAGKRITTIEGLERSSRLHPFQAAFIEHDGFGAVSARRVRSCRVLPSSRRQKQAGPAPPRSKSQDLSA
jgi:aerobic-type carbon monoxide dehydrogenase small subunit (CoxS/CutS family)